MEIHLPGLDSGRVISLERATFVALLLAYSAPLISSMIYKATTELKEVIKVHVSGAQVNIMWVVIISRCLPNYKGKVAG